MRNPGVVRQAFLQMNTRGHMQDVVIPVEDVILEIPVAHPEIDAFGFQRHGIRLEGWICGVNQESDKPDAIGLQFACAFTLRGVYPECLRSV